MALADYKNKKGLLASIIGVFCDCEYITDDDGFDSKLNFRLPFYTLLGLVSHPIRGLLIGPIGIKMGKTKNKKDFGNLKLTERHIERR